MPMSNQNNASSGDAGSDAQKEKEDQELSFNLGIFKKINYVHILLLVFLLLGFYWRFYHIDFPSIGYHNMKENEYLSQALNQYRYGDYLRRRMHIFGLDAGPGYFEEYPQMPILPWMILISWKLFGIKFWAARIIMILFSLGSVLLTYILAKKLTKNEYISLLSAFLMAYLPLGIFFGRNVQPESPALFFMLLSTIFFIDWLEAPNYKNSFFLGISLAMTAIFKYTFLIILIPWLGLVYGKISLAYFKENWKSMWKLILIILIAFSPAPLWIYFSKFLNTQITVFEGTFNRVDLFRIFTSGYWAEFTPILRSYILDNYTVWFFWLAVLGIIFFVLKFKTRFSKFMLLYFISIIPYAMILADYVKGHSYYQMPFLPLVAMSGAYFIYNIGSILAQSTKMKLAIFIPLIIIPISYPKVQQHLNAQYATIFYGLDVAADYLKQNSDQNDRFYVATLHPQSYGVCFLADRRCAGAPANITMYKLGEDNRSMKWLMVHFSGGGIQALQQDPAVFDHVQGSYSVVQMGVVRSGQGLAPVYMILKKGGSSNLTDLSNNEVLKHQPRTAKVYDTPFGNVEFYTIQ